MKPNKLSIIYPYYNSAGMLRKQLEGWNSWSERAFQHIEIILIDDGSPVAPAEPIVKEYLPLPFEFTLLRVLVDIPWNQHGARNLGAWVAENGWLFLSDIDHQLPLESVEGMIYRPLDPNKFYTLQRVTAVKKEDGNLKYDLMTDAFGKLKPHPNTFLVTKKRYWESGGYDEDFCGVYGGDGPFVRNLEKIVTREHIADLMLIRWTRDLIPDASQPPEFREKYRALYREKFDKKGGGKAPKPTRPIRFPWERVI